MTVDDLYESIAEHGRARTAALAVADERLADIVRDIAHALRLGLPVNLTECARRADVTKATLYARLPDDVLAGRAAS